MNKKIKKWEPDNFELELNSVWSFKERGDWATHDAKWRGNWSPYIPRNLILRYTNEKDLILAAILLHQLHMEAFTEYILKEMDIKTCTSQEMNISTIKFIL